MLPSHRRRADGPTSVLSLSTAVATTTSLTSTPSTPPPNRETSMPPPDPTSTRTSPFYYFRSPLRPLPHCFVVFVNVSIGVRGCYFCGRREEGRRERGREVAGVFFFSSFSMTFHGVPFFRSRNASRETVSVSVFLLSHVSSTWQITAKFLLGNQVRNLVAKFKLGSRYRWN